MIVTAPEWLSTARPELPAELDLSRDHIRFSVVMGLSTLPLPISYTWALCSPPVARGDADLGAQVLKAALRALSDLANPGPLPIGVLGPWTPAYAGLFPPKKYDPMKLDPKHRKWQRHHIDGLPASGSPHRLYPHVGEVAEQFPGGPQGWSMNVSRNESRGSTIGFSMSEWRRGPEADAEGRKVVDALLRDHVINGRRYGYLLLEQPS